MRLCNTLVISGLTMLPSFVFRYENVRKYLKEGLSAIEALRKAFTEEEEDNDTDK